MTLQVTLRNVVLVGLFVLVAVLLLGAAGVVGWEYSNSDEFCATACHNVHPEEPYSHKLSQHAQVSCVECHIGRLSTFAAMVEKSSHVTHAWAVFAGYERPLTAPSLPDASRSCEGCHTAATHQYNPIRVRSRFARDEGNTETKLTLIVRSVGRNFGGEPPRDVNWHASGAVRFIAEDPQQLDVKWVEATRRDGTTVVYEDVAAPLSADAVAAAEKNVMDCIDCHNRAGHSFDNPELLLDAAMDRRLVDPRLPFIKARLVELLDREVESEEDARQAVRESWLDYQQEFAGLAESQPNVWQAAGEAAQAREDFLVDLLVRSQFVEGEGVSWDSFPDHSGHKDAPGCFRCHSGRLQDSSGTPVPVNCTNCHSVPLVTQRDQIPDGYLTLADRRKPRNHGRPDFMARHSELASERCGSCHGEVIEHGTDNQTFCANSGCHDEQWQYLGWEALRSAD